MQTQILLELHGNKNHRNLQEFWRRFSCFQHRLSDRVIRVQVSQFLQTAEFARGESQNRLTPLVGGALSFALDHSCESPCWWKKQSRLRHSDIVILNVRTRSSGKQKSFFGEGLTPQWSREFLIRPFSSTMPFEYIIFLFRCSLLKFLALNVSFEHVWMPSFVRYASPRQNDKHKANQLSWRKWSRMRGGSDASNELEKR